MSQFKLVRDEIPKIIRDNGGKPTVAVADPEMYRKLLRAKLIEEAAEFLASDDPLELVDILEVVYALADTLGVEEDWLNQLRSDKLTHRGGFSKRFILVD